MNEFLQSETGVSLNHYSKLKTTCEKRKSSTIKVASTSKRIKGNFFIFYIKAFFLFLLIKFIQCCLSKFFFFTHAFLYPNTSSDTKNKTRSFSLFNYFTLLYSYKFKMGLVRVFSRPFLASQFNGLKWTIENRSRVYRCLY